MTTLSKQSIERFKYAPGKISSKAKKTIMIVVTVVVLLLVLYLVMKMMKHKTSGAVYYF